MDSRFIVRVPLFAAVALALGSPPARAAYDPLEIPVAKIETIDLTVHDEARSRDIPILVYLPALKSPAGVVLFSHGLGGSRKGCAYLGNHWAARGYAAVFLQHPGSDSSVWREAPVGQKKDNLKNAANAENFLLRVKDVPAVLDQLEKWNAENGHALKGRLDMTRVGMSGHSFGAVTTQAVGGQSAARGSVSAADPRIRAAIAFSPSGPRRSVDPKDAFGGVKIPWMLMTGTEDTAPIGDADLESRLSVFPALPPGGKYELVLDGARHSAFGDNLRGNADGRNPNHHRAILALSTAFWDAYLRDDPAAKNWLDGQGPASVLDPKDRWQKK